MNRILRSTLSLLVLTPWLVCAQTDPGPTRKKGSVYREEVDQLIGLVRSAAREHNLPALGGDSVLETAKVLTAMAKCHRRYYFPNDVPCVTRSVEFLIKGRQADGSFGDASATAWTVDALTSVAVAPEQFREEAAHARSWLERQGREVQAFGQVVSAVLDQVRADVFPEHLAKVQSQQVKAWVAAPGSLVRSDAVDALVQLVACQVANRLLDKSVQAPQDKVAVFTPAQQKAFGWLLEQQKDGVFSMMIVTKNDKGEEKKRSFPDVGMTGFGLLALQTKPQAMRTKEEQATIDKGLAWLVAGQLPDGTFGDRTPNYTTCVAVAALTHRKNPAYQEALEKAQHAILGFQNIEAGGYQRSDRDYGSIGYGSSQRGDLSNLHFSLEALRATGLPENHEAFSKALVFLQRTQNLKATNDFSGKVPDLDHEGVVLDATSGDDGGASYYPGNSNAGYLVQPDGKSVPRSYGSMTYALLKSYTLAGLKGDDARVQAAVKWIQQNWDLASNPGADPALGEAVKYQGLFYYYMVLAQALDLAGLKTVQVPAKPKAGDSSKGEAPSKLEIDWKKALRTQLEGMQQADGSWVNGKNRRWYEDIPLLCTCYAMAALERCQ
ncbi:MAG: prenyltransferase/squalene oxidase repeat-containing protein [Planctomycetota bacterium]